MPHKLHGILYMSTLLVPTVHAFGIATWSYNRTSPMMTDNVRAEMSVF